MLICIPTKGNMGKDDTVFGHFGSAPFFTLYNTENGEVIVLENRNAHHDHGTCHPMNQLTKHKIDCVVCSGMGRRAIEALNSEGVKIYKADSQNVSETLEQIKQGTLNEIDPSKACHGHGQRTTGQMESILESGQSTRGSGYGQGPGQGQGCQHHNMEHRDGRGEK